MHERLLEGARGAGQAPGELRDVQNWIGPPGSSLHDATYVPPPPAEMMEALSSLEKYIHQPSDLPPRRTATD